MEVKSHVIGRTVADLQLVCRFIDTYPSSQDQRVELFSVLFIRQCGRALFRSDTCPATIEHVTPLVHASLRQNTVIVLC